MTFFDLISMSVGLLYIAPFAFYYITNNGYHIKILLGLVGTTVLSETIKYKVIGDLSPRPTGAKNCNFLCTDGKQSGAPGMPSSHSAEVAFFSGAYYQLTDSTFLKTCIVIYAALVMYSRHIKRCHTINQIVAGALLGLSLSWLLVRHL
jgi:membrane-associated phospholipid phosphatase